MTQAHRPVTQMSGKRSSFPATGAEYRGFGSYLMLGLVIEAASGLQISDALHTLVFEPANVPRSAWHVGEASAENHHRREWAYDSRGELWINVFHPAYSAELLNSSSNCLNMPGAVAQGGIVIQPAALLKGLNQSCVALGSQIGEPRPAPGMWKAMHRGSQPGSTAIVWQRGDGLDFAIMLNAIPGSPMTVLEIAKEVDRLLDEGALPWGQPLMDAKMLAITITP